MEIIIIIALFVFTVLVMVSLSFFVFFAVINYLYEINHFIVKNGQTTYRHVWWGKYFGYKDTVLPRPECGSNEKGYPARK